jgi:hypothetical protein
MPDGKNMGFNPYKHKLYSALFWSDLSEIYELYGLREGFPIKARQGYE